MNPHDPVARLANIKEQYDVAIVGAGIYGATAAWEAASRGLSVVLLDKSDFGSSTSANSLKTIHGGLRALQRLDFVEMREYIRERRALMRIAPHLVSPMPCVMPTYRSLTKSKLFIGAGLKVYDLIAIDRNRGIDASHRIPSSSIVTKEHLEKLAPDLDRKGVTGGACWFDGQAYNTERLTLSFVMSSIKAGADVFSYLEKTAYLTNKGAISGVTAKDKLTGRTLNLKAASIIDCTGPWAFNDEGFRSNTRGHPPEIMARAVNIVIRRKISKYALGINASSDEDGSQRLLFVAPWRSGSIVGTWYYPETTLPDRLAVSTSELSDWLSQINSVFPSLKIEQDDVSLVHIGLQPAQPGKSANSEPNVWRHTKILRPAARARQEGLFWVQGVKLTTARATAVEVVDLVARYLKKSLKPSRTHVSRLYGADFDNYSQYRESCVAKLGARLPKSTVLRLLANYGSNTERIVELINQEPTLSEDVPGAPEMIKAELHFVIDNEQPMTLSDLLMRRTDAGSFSRPENETLDFCADLMTEKFSWSEDVRRKNIDDLLLCYPTHSQN